MLSDTKDLLYVALTDALHRLRDSTPGNAICEHEARLMFDNMIKLKAPQPFFLSGKKNSSEETGDMNNKSTSETPDPLIYPNNMQFFPFLDGIAIDVT